MYGVGNMANKNGNPQNLKPCTKENAKKIGSLGGRPVGRKSIGTYTRWLVEEASIDDLPPAMRDHFKKMGIDSVALGLALKKLEIAFNAKNKADTQLRSIESMEDRLDGKPIQKTELTGKDGEALLLENKVSGGLDCLNAKQLAAIKETLENE